MSEIDELRRTIAGIDAGIVELVARRLSVAEEIGACKRRQGLPVCVPDVEDAVRRRYAEEAVKNGVSEETAKELADLLIAACRRIQE